MNAHVEKVAGELIDDVGEFFAPMSSDLVDGLIGEFDRKKAEIEALAAVMADPAHSSVLHYFIEGNTPEQRSILPTAIEKLFNIEGAVAKLTAAYWDRALRMTDVFDYMPQKRRDEWREQIASPLGKKTQHWDQEKKKRVENWQIQPLPAFEEDTVRSTLHGLLLSRSKFLAERVDGIFRALSRTHVTNRPEGFGKRMILPGVICSFGTINWSTSGVINDLRCVIAKFMGRDEPRHGATDAVIKAARKQNGQWQGVDGNAFRIRVYNGVGTAHIEVHPDMAWRLNSILAHLHPAAIPAEARTRPAKPRKVKDFNLFDRPLPFAVIGILSSLEEAHEPVENPGYGMPRFRKVAKTRELTGDLSYLDKHALAEAVRVIEAIGGVPMDGKGRRWVFDYEPQDALDQILCTGGIPDQKSHQFYPTPESLAIRAVDLAEIGDEHLCLEPSAGTGGLANHMPKDRTDCVEISKLHFEILKAKGHNAICMDFVKVADTLPGRDGDGRYDRIIMNPPYDQGRWLAHVEAAAGLVCQGGRLVAILPEGAAKRLKLPGFTMQWHGPFANEFAGTSIAVTILVADRT